MADSSKNQSYSLISVEKAENRSFEDLVSAAASANFSVEVPSSEKENNTSRVRQASSGSIAGDQNASSFDGQEASKPSDVREGSKPHVGQMPSSSPEVKKSASSSEESALDNLTEEDLRGSAPLENMHKIILVVLILALIVFAVYFFVSM